jgi:radical SAM/Cys-rich protein
VLQLNLGKVCNQTCTHCHVDAGPDRRESMSRETAELCLRVLEDSDIPTLDLTGGAPELNPQFRFLVREARRLARRVIDRSNLTILTVPGYDDLAEFLASEGVEVVASLPCYLEENCDRQRGAGVYQRSIDALGRLNRLGYGRPGSKLVLHLVYNPVGPSLPPPQPELEVAYRRELRERHGVEFTHLYTITNMPINRFLDDLLRNGQYEAYMDQLVMAFNPATIDRLMCRTTLSVDWRGSFYDCDFNQMLELPVNSGAPTSIFDATVSALEQRFITTGPHCFGCTAGGGSSCSGAVLR